MYYNTTSETGTTLERSHRKAATQQERIMELFKQGGEFTPDEIHSRLNTRAPLTSTRRAITNLTREGRLEKTDKQRIGMYGKMTYVWRMRRVNGHQISLFSF